MKIIGLQFDKSQFSTSEWDTQIKNCWSIGLQRRREADNASEGWVVSCEDWKSNSESSDVEMSLPEKFFN